MRLITAMALLTCCAAAVGCGRHQPLLNNNAPTVTAPAARADGQLAFTGRWAASPKVCGHAAWTMTGKALQSPGPLHCEVSQLTPTLAGFTVNAVCSQGGAGTPGRIVMTMTEQGGARALTMSGGPFNEPVSLVRCPAQ